LARKLALRTNIHLLTNSIPSFTSVASFDCIRDRLRLIREKSITVDDSTLVTLCLTTIDGCTNTTLTPRQFWSNEWFKILLP
jgi:hypothetical protein